jgi:hypothetical protein
VVFEANDGVGGSGGDGGDVYSYSNLFKIWILICVE